jgi:hypothetical protein
MVPSYEKATRAESWLDRSRDSPIKDAPEFTNVCQRGSAAADHSASPTDRKASRNGRIQHRRSGLVAFWNRLYIWNQKLGEANLERQIRGG